MESYIEQINNIQDIVKRVDENMLIDFFSEVDFKNYNIGVCGNNIKKNDDVINMFNMPEIHIKTEEMNQLLKIKYDAVILILDAVQPVCRGDMELYEDIKNECLNVIFLLKNMKYIDEEDKNDIIKYIKKKTFDITGISELYIFDDSENMQLLINKLKNSPDLKKISLSYKINFIITKAIKIFKDKIYKAQNFSEYKNCKKDEIEKEIKNINYIGEGTAYYFNNLCKMISDKDSIVSNDFYGEFIKGMNYFNETYLEQENNTKLVISNKSFDKDSLIELINEYRKTINCELKKKINIKEKEMENLNSKNNCVENIELYVSALKQLMSIKGFDKDE